MVPPGFPGGPRRPPERPSRGPEAPWAPNRKSGGTLGLASFSFSRPPVKTSLPPLGSLQNAGEVRG
eukprot:3713731-Pyramimonas_sp.AAC.1